MVALLIWILSVVNHRIGNENELQLACFSGYNRGQLKTIGRFSKCANEKCQWQCINDRHEHGCKFDDEDCVLLHVIATKKNNSKCPEKNSALLPGRAFLPYVNEIYNRGRISMKIVERAEEVTREAMEQLKNLLED
jgi:hypothetical protein